MLIAEKWSTEVKNINSFICNQCLRLPTDSRMPTVLDGFRFLFGKTVMNANTNAGRKRNFTIHAEPVLN